jgi:ATP-binding cassette, subfamily C, bacterial LapB
MARSLRKPEQDIGPSLAAGSEAVQSEWPTESSPRTGASDPDRPGPAAGGPVEPGTWRAPGGGLATEDALLGCVVILTRLLERPTSAQALTAGLPLADGQLSPELAVRAVERAGLAARLVRQPLDRISALTLPCVLLLENRSACVLVNLLPGERALVAVPETGGGTIELPLAGIAERYVGYALFARPQLRLDRRAEQVGDAQPRSWFWGTLAQAWPIYSEVLLAAVLINLFALASPLFIMNVYDRVVPNRAIETLWVLAGGVAIVFVFDFALRNLRAYFVDSAGRMADLKLASRIFEQVMGICMAARPASAGAFANNLREFESLRDFFTSATVVTLVDLPFVLLFIGIVWLIGGPVALVPAMAVPLVIGLGLILQVPLNRVVRRTFQEAAQKHGVLVESISGLETIRSVGAEGRMQRDWERFVSATAHSGMRARLLSGIVVNFSLLVQNLVTAGVVIVGVYRIAEGLMTVGALVGCTIITSLRRAGPNHGPPRRATGADALPASTAAARRAGVQGGDLQLSRAKTAGARQGVVRDQGRRARRGDRPYRLRQDHGREAGIGPVRAGSGCRTDRRHGSAPDRSRGPAPQHWLRAPGRVPVPRYDSRQHHAWCTVRRRRGGAARGARCWGRGFRRAPSSRL